MVGTLGPLPNLGSLTKQPSIGGGTSYDYWADQRGSYSYNPFQTMQRYEPTFNFATSQYTQVPVTDFAHTFTTNEAVNGALMGNYSLIAEGVSTMAAELAGFQPSSTPQTPAALSSQKNALTNNTSSSSSPNGFASMSQLNALTAAPATFNPGTSATAPQVGLFLPGAGGLTPTPGANTFSLTPQSKAFLQAGGLQPYNGWGFTMLPYPGTQTIVEPAAAAASIANNVPTPPVSAVNPALSSSLLNDAAQGQFASTSPSPTASVGPSTAVSVPGTTLAGVSALANNRSVSSGPSPSSAINALQSNSPVAATQLSAVAQPIATPTPAPTGAFAPGGNMYGYDTASLTGGITSQTVAAITAPQQPIAAAPSGATINPTAAAAAPATTPPKTVALQQAEALDDTGSNAGIKALTDGANSKASSIWKAYKAELADPANKTKEQAEAEEAASGGKSTGKSVKSSGGGGGDSATSQQTMMMNMMMMMFMMQMMNNMPKGSGAESAQMSQMMQAMMASMGGGMMPTATTTQPTAATVQPTATAPTSPAPSGLAAAQQAVANNNAPAGQVTAPTTAPAVDPKKVDIRKLQALANNSHKFTPGPTGTCVVSTEKNVRAVTGDTPWSNTGTPDKCNTGEALRQALTSGKYFSVAGDLGPVAFKNDRGQVGFHTMSVQDFERKVANGEIPAGALVAQTRHDEWHDKNGAYGYDMAVLTQDKQTGKAGLFNFKDNKTTRIYGDRTKSVVVLLPKAQTA
jgi:hypothetical protein